MVDMPDYAHPYAPSITANANALTQLQSFFNAQQKQQDVQTAGGLAAGGDIQGGTNALLRGGHMDEAMQMYKYMKSVNDSEAAEAKDTYSKFGNAARLAQNPQQWNALLGTLKSAGHDISGYEDFGTGRQKAIMLADQVDAYHKQIQQEKENELASIKIQLAKKELSGEGEASKLQKVGGTVLGGDIYGYPNAKAGTVTLPKYVSPEGEPLERGPGGAFQPATPAAPVPAAPAPTTHGLMQPAALPGGAQGQQPAPEQERAAGLNPDALSDLSPGQQNRVRAIQRGDEVIQQRDKIGQALMERVYAFDPSFSKTDSEARRNFKIDFMKANGKSNQNAVNYDTAIQHMVELSHNIDQLPDTGVQPVNAAKNWWARMRTDPNMADLIANANLVAGETAKVTHGGVSEHEHQRILDSFDPAQGKTALGGVLAKYVQLLAGKQNAMEHNWKQNAGAAEFPREMISPESRAGIEALKQKYGVGAPGRSGAGPALPKVGDVQKGYRYKGGDPSKQESWEPAQ